MYTLTIPKKVAVISALLEGNSIRSMERMTGIHRDTIMRLLVSSGNHCAELLHVTMRDLRCRYIQCDEIWTYVGKKERQISQDDSPDLGNQWVFVAIDAETKLVPSFTVGKRTRETTYRFLTDLKSRLTEERFQLTTDGFHFYTRGVEYVFGGTCDFAQLIKLFGYFGQHATPPRTSPGHITELISKVRHGRPDPDHISTSHVERQNLTMRMAMRRFTRLTNAFSKSLKHLKAAVALHFAFYNFARTHKSLRCTPAMEAGIADHFWGIKELLEAA